MKRQVLHDLEYYFIYEIQHIYIDGKTHKYFNDKKLLELISEGQVKYNCINKSMIYATIKCLETIVDDIKNKRSNYYMVGDHSEQEFAKNIFMRLINDYSGLLMHKPSTTQLIGSPVEEQWGSQPQQAQPQQ